MKAKFLLILLSALFIIPVNAETTKTKKRRSSIRHTAVVKRSTRTPLDFRMSVNDGDNTLIILFQSSLPDAEISVKDNDGNTVVYEPQTFINEGEMIYIYTPNAYPYIIEITSPVMDVTGEIVLEETI